MTEENQKCLTNCLMKTETSRKQANKKNKKKTKQIVYQLLIYYTR